MMQEDEDDQVERLINEGELAPPAADGHAAPC